MSFKTLKVKVEFDMVVSEERFDAAIPGLSYELLHKIRVALYESKEYMISMPCVTTETLGDKK